MSKDMRDQHGLSSGLLWTKDGEAKWSLLQMMSTGKWGVSHFGVKLLKGTLCTSKYLKFRAQKYGRRIWQDMASSIKKNAGFRGDVGHRLARGLQPNTMFQEWLLISLSQKSVNMLTLHCIYTSISGCDHCDRSKITHQSQWNSTWSMEHF